MIYINTFLNNNITANEAETLQCKLRDESGVEQDLKRSRGLTRSLVGFKQRIAEKILEKFIRPTSNEKSTSFNIKSNFVD